MKSKTMKEFIKEKGLKVDETWLKTYEEPHTLFDFEPLDEGKELGLISEDEYQLFFEKTRLHGGDFENPIFPFCVGGSDAAVILDLSPFMSVEELTAEKTGMKKREVDERTKLMFRAGHLFEAPIRNLFEELSGLTAVPCGLQFMHPDSTRFPHLVGNIDGLVLENGELGIYEGKTTSPHSKVYDELVNGRIPIAYEIQVRFYMEITNLSFAYVCGAWGFKPDQDIAYVRIERDPELGEMILQACEDYVSAVMNEEPIPPSFHQSHESIVRRIVNFHPDACGEADLTDHQEIFEELNELTRKKEALRKVLAPDAAMEKAKKELEEIDEKTQKLKDQLLVILSSQDADSGVLTSGKDSWKVQYDVKESPCFDFHVKATFKRKYPEVYKEIMSLKKNASVSLAVTKNGKTILK